MVCLNTIRFMIYPNDKDESYLWKNDIKFIWRHLEQKKDFFPVNKVLYRPNRYDSSDDISENKRRINQNKFY